MRTYRDSIILRASKLMNEAFDMDNYNQDPNAPVEETEGPEELDDTTLNDDAEQTYDVDVANPICPCCGARLNIVDNSDEESEDEENGIEAMDPSLEPEEYTDNDDAYVTIDDIDDEDVGAEEEKEEEEEDDDSDEESGERIEAF